MLKTRMNSAEILLLISILILPAKSLFVFFKNALVETSNWSPRHYRGLDSCRMGWAREYSVESHGRANWSARHDSQSNRNDCSQTPAFFSPINGHPRPSHPTPTCGPMTRGTRLTVGECIGARRSERSGTERRNSCRCVDWSGEPSWEDAADRIRKKGGGANPQ